MTQRQLGVDPTFEDGEPRLRQSRPFEQSKWRITDPFEWEAMPLVECVLVGSRRDRGIEAGEVELVGLDRQDIAGAIRTQPVAQLTVTGTEVGNEPLHRVASRLRSFVPQGVDDLIRGHATVPLKEQ